VREWEVRHNRGPDQPVVTLAESDYRFGAGPLRLAVMRVLWQAPQRDGAEAWYEVEGIEMTGDGREVGPRTTFVRGSRLRVLQNKSSRHQAQ
jgi:hypothetical protein